VLARDSRESTVDLLAAANCSGVLNIVNLLKSYKRNRDEPLQGFLINAALHHAFDYNHNENNVKQFCAPHHNFLGNRNQQLTKQIRNLARSLCCKAKA
jgi:hypothetical protein